MGIPLPITTSFWSKWSPDGSCINVIPKSGLQWPSPMPLDLVQHRLRFHLTAPIFVAGFRRLWGLGCWLTWREPGCDSFATALSGSRQNCSIKVTTRALANGVSVDPAKKTNGVTCQRAKLTQRPSPCQSPDGFRLLGARQCEALPVGKRRAVPDERRRVSVCSPRSQPGCLFAPSESCHLIAGCPSKLRDKLIQRVRDDHCVDRRRHRDDARARRDQGQPWKNRKNLTQHRTLGTQVESAWLFTAPSRPQGVIC